MSLPREPEKCPCGRPLHYRDPAIRLMIEDFIHRQGPEIEVTTHLGTWLVPRHFIALHGLRVRELPELAQRYGFKKV